MQTVSRLRRAAGALARHVAPGGVLVVEPWYGPADWRPNTVHAQVVDEPELKVARLNRSEQEGTLARTDMHYLVATPKTGVTYFVEPHTLGLFEPAEYRAAFEDAGLAVEHVEVGPLTGRGIYIGTRPLAP
jgi:hypothetical protein